MITLEPGATESNITYSQVLTQFKEKVSLEDLGITDVRFRVASTGSRILELPGSSNGDKADALAQQLRGVLDGNIVSVTRPTMCAEMRISGLDDSVTSEEVAVAVSRAGGCEVEAVKVGEVRQGRNGMGTTWVRCPVLAAKKVSGGRLLVGFVSARVQLLQRRVQRCFRCHEVGHMAAKCTCEVDRSNHCFRCGSPGHKKDQCSADPHCPVCEAAHRPARHMLGGAACAKLSALQKGKRRGGDRDVARPAGPASSNTPTKGGEVLTEHQ